MVSTAEVTSSLRALVVDDEESIRMLAVAALTKEGFVCDMADDGQSAWQHITESRTPYDLVVTDLAMPRRNGHALAVDLLAMPERPLVTILTGVTDPRLTRDLIARGVDDFVIKPVKFAPFAAKMRALADRRHKLSTPDAAAAEAIGEPVAVQS